MSTKSSYILKKTYSFHEHQALKGHLRQWLPLFYYFPFSLIFSCSGRKLAGIGIKAHIASSGSDDKNRYLFGFLKLQQQCCLLTRNLFFSGWNLAINLHISDVNFRNILFRAALKRINQNKTSGSCIISWTARSQVMSFCKTVKAHTFGCVRSCIMTMCLTKVLSNQGCLKLRG